MAGWSDWYSGNMAPPLSLPGGGYAPAPSYVPPSTVDELYRGIYGDTPTGLTSRSVRTVPVPPSITTMAQGGLGTGMRASGSATYYPPALPNQPAGSVRTSKSDARLPQTSRDADLLTGYAPLSPPNSASAAITAATRNPMSVAGGGYGKLGAGGFASGSLTLPKRSSSDVITLAFDPMSDTSGQNMANSSGKPVRGPSGKTYYPTNGATDKVRAPMRPVGNPPAVPGGQRQGGGLLSLFGGNGGGGGLLAGLFGGAVAPRTQAVAQPSSGPAIYTPQGNVHPGSFYDNSGNDMAFMPQSYQDNPRNSNGGY